MTCIVGMVDAKAGTVRLGADSASSNGWTIRDTKTPKLCGFKYPHLDPEGDGFDLVLGYTSSYRMGQLLMQALTVPSRGHDDVEKWVVTKFVPAVRDVFKTGGFAKVDSNVETGGTFLLGIEGRLFEIQDDYSALEAIAPFGACGSGEAFAMGAMATGASIDDALKVAAELTATVRGPFNFIETRA